MNRRSIAVTCRQRIVELTHPQGTPLDIVLSLGPGMSITESTVFRADLQTARFPASAPLARTADVTAAPGAAGPWTLALSGGQLNQTVTGESSRFWLPIYAVVAGTRIEPLVGIVITLTANNISSLAPPPPVEPIYLTAESASDLYAALADFDALADRVTSLESNEGGGAQADWAAPSGPSAILNKPTLGNSSSRNVGTGAGDVATGNHGHTTSQIAGLDTALAGKAATSHSHATSDVTGLDTALAGKAASSHTHTTSQITGLDTALANKADLSGGKLLVSQLPDLAIKEYLGAPANQAAMLALNGQRGDWCSRLDDGKIWVVTGEPSSSLANWFALTYPNAPVLSVAGRTGSITLGIGDISGLQGALDAKADSGSLLSLAFRDTVGSAQIDAAAVINAKLAAMAAATLKGSIAGGTPADLTATQVTSLLNTFTSALKGLVPASGGGTTNFLRADGTFAAPPGGSPAGSGSELQIRNAGAFGAVPNSSVSGGAVTLGAAENYGSSPLTLFAVRNTTAATNPGVSQVLTGQQSSPAFQLEGQGWDYTGGVATSTPVRVRLYAQPQTPFGLAAVPNILFRLETQVGSGAWSRLVEFRQSPAQGFYANFGPSGAIQLGGSTNGGSFPDGLSTNAVLLSGNTAAVDAVRMTGSGGLVWTSDGTIFSSISTWLRRRGAANICLGNVDTATLVAQTISVQSASGTDTSAAAAVFTLDGAQGTGTGAGGDVRVRVAPNGSTGASQNTLVEAIRWRATDRATVCAGAVIAGGPVVLPSFTVGTVPSASLWTRGLIYVSDDVGGATPSFSDGTNWRRVADRAVVSTP